MQKVIFNPQEEFDTALRERHFSNATTYLDALVKHSGVDIEENRKTVQEYYRLKEDLKSLMRKRNWLRFFRVLMCITVILIPLVIWKMTPRIRALKQEIETADQKAEQLLKLAYRQMQPLNSLFTQRDALQLIEDTVPLIRFHSCFDARQEEDMKINYDFRETDPRDQSTLDVLSGHYNENPFLFENKLIHTMGTETYHGYKTIHWTETYRDSNGKLQTRSRSQTLHATVEKPKPFYSTQVVLNYCAQGGPELSFSRDATHLHKKSDKAIERYVKKGSRKLKKKTDEAIRKNDDFMSMSNEDFEVLFDALDRTDEVQFRTLFTPLAQTNMVDLILSKTGFGDDFHFIKQRRSNRIISTHSQGRDIDLKPECYQSFSFDIIRENFIGKNTEYFKAVYFDFAPLWAIPMYQERPVHSLKPIPDHSRQYSLKECEVLANALKETYTVHPDTKTRAILKSSYVGSRDGMDETCVTAYSYDIMQRVDVVPVMGGDGRVHSVNVPWDEYLPLTASNTFFVASETKNKLSGVAARRNGLCISPANHK